MRVYFQSSAQMSSCGSDLQTGPITLLSRAGLRSRSGLELWLCWVRRPLVQFDGVVLRDHGAKVEERRDGVAVKAIEVCGQILS
jgi:hypothetical protein